MGVPGVVLSVWKNPVSSECPSSAFGVGFPASFLAVKTEQHNNKASTDPVAAEPMIRLATPALTLLVPLEVGRNVR